MGVDEARHHDPVRRVDHRGVARGDVGTHRIDLAVLDQHVGSGEVADGAVEREHDAALEQDAARALHAREVGIALRRGAAGECAGSGKRSAGRENGAPGRNNSVVAHGQSSLVDV